MLNQQNNRLALGQEREPQENFSLWENIIEDRGSRYSVSVGRVENREDIKLFLKTLKARKKYAKATHNSWATRIVKDGVVYESKNDDGETGAGMVILRTMLAHDVSNCVVCVTRWFGGVKLQGDRFRHVKDATLYAIKHIE